MSYRTDMERIKKQRDTRKKRVELMLKCSIVILAVALLVTGVAVGIALANGGFFADYDEDEPSGNDRKAPVIKGPEGDRAVVYLGEGIAYKSLISVSDDSGDYTLSVDNSKVNQNVEGTYQVKYVAKDAAGNKTEYTLTLIIKNGEYSKTKLMALVEAKAKELGITKEMTKEQQVRKIYDFVNSPNKSVENANIVFTDESNTPSQQMSRDNWEIDWIEEACRTLSMSRMGGDCYTYYAVSKAFFEYFEIENMGIQRSARSTEAGTHFWSIVNIGTKENPKWYYYDATRLAGSFDAEKSKYGCLITEATLQSYTTSKGGREFYLFDKWDGFPAISTQKIS